MIDVNPEQLAEIKRMLEEYVPDCEIRAFGSPVTGRAKPWSDLDLAIVGPEPMGLRRRGRMVEAFRNPRCRSALTCWTGTTFRLRFRPSLAGSMQ